ncbi:MAG: carbohydrate-binding domain-containing protein [Clostridia bacterium]|nr:carbohydrate-binding domain-containing protein [Clostridia bacterium]
MRKKFIMAIAVFCVLCLSLCACNKKEETPDGPSSPVLITRALSFPVEENIGGAIANLEANAVKNDGNDYDENSPMSETAVFITLADDASTVTDGNGNPYPDDYAAVSGNVIHIQKAGTYVLTGSLSDGQIVIGTDDRAQLIFRDAHVHCSNRPAMEIYGTGKKILTMSDGTNNSLSDDNDRADVTKDGVIRAAHAVTINGKGSLTIAAKFGSAVCADALKVLDCNFTVSEAKTNALRCGAFLYISGSTASVCANGYSLWAADETIVNTSRLDLVGGVYGRDVFFDGSTIDLTSREDGVFATRLISARNTALSINAEGDGLRATGEDATSLDGIIRLFDCKTVVSDGDDGIRARYFSFSGGNLICVGMGTQLCVTEGAACSWNIEEILFPDGIASGTDLQLGETKVALKRKSRIVVYVGPIYDQMELRVGEKAVLGWATAE